MNKQQKIDAINKAMWRKELKAWDKFTWREQWYCPEYSAIYIDEGVCYNEDTEELVNCYSQSGESPQPVMIGDVLDWMWEKMKTEMNEYWVEEISFLHLEVIDLRKHKRKPIESQSEECIDFIYLLISNELTRPTTDGEDCW